MMQIEITARQLAGCTDFIPHPSRLYLGSQNAEGVDTLAFDLPAEWAGKSVSLHLEQADGVRPTPLLLDSQGRVAVDRRLTAARSGRGMLTATDGEGYTAYTRPGCYDTCETLPTDGAEEPPSASLYEQFVAQVLDSAAAAQTHASQAAGSASQAAAAAGQAESCASAAQTHADASDASADRAEAAALRAEAAAPVEGYVISVNSMGGRVQLDAGDVGALPLPANASAGCLVRIQAVDQETGAVSTEAVPEADLDSFVLRTDLPTAQQAGPIKLSSGYGLALTAGGELRLTPASTQQITAMTESWAPVTPALIPLAVKLALTASQAAAGWTDDDRAAARALLDAAQASALEALSARVETLELKFNTNITEHTFAVDFATLSNLTAAGVWNTAEERIEF